jgi:hypothetical protein
MASKTLEDSSVLVDLLRSVFGDDEAIRILEKLIEHPMETYTLTLAFDAVNEHLNGDFSGKEPLVRALLEWYGPAKNSQLH